MDPDIFNDLMSDDGSTNFMHGVVLDSSKENESSSPPFFNFGRKNTFESRVIKFSNDIYREKYRKLKKKAKDYVFENAALCDEVARLQEKILVAKEERKFLLKKLQSYQSSKDGSAQTNPVYTLSAAGLGKIGGESSEPPPPAKKRNPVKKRPPPKTAEDKSKPKKKKSMVPKRLLTPIPLDPSGRPVYPISLDALTIHSLGVIVSDRPGFHTDNCIYPVGFCSSRTYASLKNPTVSCLYQCTVQDSAFGPKFEIVPEDNPSHTFLGTSPNEVHSGLLRTLNSICGQEVVATEGQGEKFFGLSHPTVQNLIQSCAGARKCTDYCWMHFEVAKDDQVTKDFDPTINFDVLMHVLRDL